MKQIKVGSKGVLNYVLALQEHFLLEDEVEVVARGHSIDRMIQAVLMYKELFSKYPLDIELNIMVDPLDNGYTSKMSIVVRIV